MIPNYCQFLSPFPPHTLPPPYLLTASSETTPLPHATDTTPKSTDPAWRQCLLQPPSRYMCSDLVRTVRMDSLGFCNRLKKQSQQNTCEMLLGIRTN